ncbi:hypothetical protein [Pasteuria penetrans]|uniref:hypothetical protein n=1 Tax=Pasteuria penetrans TaxID=86005 RepID=UPI000FBBF8BB|nr:hypothetical protein [Pasteuria penetrans]
MHLLQGLEVEEITLEGGSGHPYGFREGQLGHDQPVELNKFIYDKGMKLNKEGKHLFRLEVRQDAPMEMKRFLLEKIPGSVIFIYGTEITGADTDEVEGLLLTSVDSSFPPVILIWDGNTNRIYRLDEAGLGTPRMRNRRGESCASVLMTATGSGMAAGYDELNLPGLVIGGLIGAVGGLVWCIVDD